MPDKIDLTKLDAVTPSVYLKQGFFAAPGKLRPELTGLAAFGTAQRLERAAASPDELAATFEALKQVLPARTEAPAKKFAAAVEEALALVGRMLNIPNNIMIAGWLRECAPFVKTPADLAACLEHFQAVTLQYTTLLAVKQPKME